jgi:hypothetical protein
MIHPAADLSEEERQALRDAGVWSDDLASFAWAIVSPNGSVWAGAKLEPGALVAKVRGKNGRRLGQGRNPKAVEDKRATLSIVLSPASKAKAKQIAATRSSAGRAVSVSQVIDELIANA